jgi:Fe-S oxidoreductase
MARENIDLLGKYEFGTLLTHCPHSFNTFQHEYPQLGGRLNVVHHSQFLLDILRAGTLSPTRPIGETVTYHDPCYLGRYNWIYEQPREVLLAIPGLELVEMDQSGRSALCCGAGGGLAWTNIFGGQRINYLRLEGVEEVDVTTLATACPLCKMMLCDAVAYRDLQSRIRVKDIAELLLEAQPERTS